MLLVYEFSFYSEAREKRLWEQVTWQPFLLLASILELGYLCEVPLCNPQRLHFYRQTLAQLQHGTSRGRCQHVCAES